MEENLDPHWTEKLERGRIIDPLHLDTVRNRILTDLVFGIQSVAINQRLRYISFSLWCLDNLEDPSIAEIVPYEKLFLLANVAHDHVGPKNREELGISGSDNIPWSSKELLESKNSSFSISDEKFRIQSRSEKVCGFSTYYRGVMERLLLIDGLKPTPLGKTISREFERSVGIEFNELREVVRKEEVTSKFIKKFTDACCCLLSGQEEELLRKSFFALFNSTNKYSQLQWKKIDNCKESDLSCISALDKLGFMGIEDTINIERYLRRYFKGKYGIKMRKSLLMFLWIANQEGNTPEPISSVYELKDIRELWRLQQYYDYFNFGCEALLSAVLLKLNHEGPTYPSDLLSSITQNDFFKQTLGSLSKGLDMNQSEKEISSIENVYQYIYYGISNKYRLEYSLNNEGNDFNGNWDEFLDNLKNMVNVDFFDINSPLNEWGLKKLIEKEINSPKGNIDKTCSRIFGYVTTLFGLLKLRYDTKFKDDSYRIFLNWLKMIEQNYPGPTSIVRSLESSKDLQQFIESIAWKWVIKQHINSVYEKTTRSRMPRLFYTDFQGRLEHEKSWEPTLSTLKFKRLVDILYDLGLVKNPSIESFPISDKGKDWLDNFIEVKR